MRLTDLEPRWLSDHVFVFKCPHCRGILLSCKDVPMSMHDQMELFARTLGEDDWNRRVVPMKEDCAWAFSTRDFATMSVAPSLDATASGHWHNTIVNGECPA